jgi:hypothetical protein
METKTSIDRREFLRVGSVAGLGLAFTDRFRSPALLFGGSPSEKVVVAVMGLNGRGMCSRGTSRA